MKSEAWLLDASSSVDGGAAVLGGVRERESVVDDAVGNSGKPRTKIT